MVPAKDEEASIESCLRSLLAQNHPDFEILVVDDRSEDSTAEIVERIAAETDRVQLVRIRDLPPGWTGKTHALHECSRHARGEWFLFVDADTVLEPSCLNVALRDALDHGADLESLMPALDSRSFWEKTIQPFAGICLMAMYPLPRVNDPSKRNMGFANGQFILILREAYERIGGHETVRDKFVEDVHLGRLIRTNDLGLRVVMGRDVAAVRMYSSLDQIVRGWSRILYSAVDSRPAPLVGLFASILVFSVLSYAAVGIGGAMLLAGWSSKFLNVFFGLAVVHQVAQTTIMARIYALSRSSLAYLAFRVIAVFVMLYVVAKTIRMCRTHEVTWRGTTYGKELMSD